MDNIERVVTDFDDALKLLTEHIESKFSVDAETQHLLKDLKDKAEELSMYANRMYLESDILTDMTEMAGEIKDLKAYIKELEKEHVALDNLGHEQLKIEESDNEKIQEENKRLKEENEKLKIELSERKSSLPGDKPDEPQTPRKLGGGKKKSKRRKSKRKKKKSTKRKKKKSR